MATELERKLSHSRAAYGFAVEALPEVLGLDARQSDIDRLDGDDAVDQWVAGAKNDAHGPAADLLEELVAT